MDIACPHCAATYRVPESLVAGGKALRCAACGQEWVPQAVGGEAADGAAVAALGAALGTAPGATSGAVSEPEAMAAAQPAEREPDPPVTSGLAPVDPPPLLPRREPGQRTPAEPPRTPPLLPAAWIVSLAAVVLGLAALYLYRAPIAAAWPPFGRLF